MALILRLRTTVARQTSSEMSQPPDWMPITPKTGSLFHAETQRVAGISVLLPIFLQKQDATVQARIPSERLAIRGALPTLRMCAGFRKP